MSQVSIGNAGLFSSRQIACQLVLDSGAHCVCTGTGLRAAATTEDVRSLRAAVGVKFGVKAVGLSDLQGAIALIEAGTTRLGTVESVAPLSLLPG